MSPHLHAILNEWLYPHEQRYPRCTYSYHPVDTLLTHNRRKSKRHCCSPTPFNFVIKVLLVYDLMLRRKLLTCMMTSKGYPCSNSRPIARSIAASGIIVPACVPPILPRFHKGQLDAEALVPVFFASTNSMYSSNANGLKAQWIEISKPPSTPRFHFLHHAPLYRGCYIFMSPKMTALLRFCFHFPQTRTFWQRY